LAGVASANLNNARTNSNNNVGFRADCDSVLKSQVRTVESQGDAFLRKREICNSGVFGRRIAEDHARDLS